MEYLSPRDQEWARSFAAGAGILWDEGDSSLADGQNRLCALRAAGVLVVPVFGRYLPCGDTAGRTTARPSRSPAQETVDRFWVQWTSDHIGPGASARWLGWVVARCPWSRRFLPRPDRDRD
ncbi:hypothetical protein P3T39_006408 [Kitasatospora sp. GP82]|nr:hypothetical protein [Kitasatospora sp. GP82]